MSDIGQKSLEYWSGRAEEYSSFHMKSFNSEKHRWFADIVHPYIPRLDRPVEALDLGCGSGFMSLLLLEAGCTVQGIDFSEDMIAQAKANVASKGFDATYTPMKAQELAFDDASFDFVLSRNVTWVLEDVDKVYAEVFRVLRPGGVFLNLDANYGKAFMEQDARGETPQHPTQSLEQLRTRNEIASELAISHVERPAWDVSVFWGLGAHRVSCERVSETMFALSVYKPE